MSNFERFPIIDAELRQFLLDYSDISDLVGSRCYAKKIPADANKNVAAPLIMFKMAGGNYGQYRVYFKIRAADATTMDTLKRAVVRRMHSPINLPSGVNIVDAVLDGQPADGGDESVGWFECSFYMLVELLEAGYG